MFVKSFKTNKKTLIGGLCVILATLCLCIWALSSAEDVETTSSQKKTGTLTYKAATNEELLAFISHYGWEVEIDPAENVELIITSEFN